jgi:hypothetical protein
MFGGAASAATGTANDGVPSTSTTTNTTTSTPGGFTNSFNNAATQKAIISSALSGNPSAVIGAIATSALTSQPTQSATPVPAASSNFITNAINSLKAEAKADPVGVSNALKVIGVASSFAPGGSFVVGLLNSVVAPSIAEGQATQAAQAALANPNTVTIPGINGLPPINITFDSAALDSFESAAENDGGFGEAPTLSNEGLSNAVDGQDAANARDSDPAQFGGNDPPSNDNGSYSNSLTRSDSDSSDGGP